MAILSLPIRIALEMMDPRWRPGMRLNKRTASTTTTTSSWTSLAPQHTSFPHISSRIERLFGLAHQAHLASAVPRKLVLTSPHASPLCLIVVIPWTLQQEDLMMDLEHRPSVSQWSTIP